MRNFIDRLESSLRLFLEARAYRGAIIRTARGKTINADHVVDAGTFYYLGLRHSKSKSLMPKSLSQVRRILGFFGPKFKGEYVIGDYQPFYADMQIKKFEEIITINKVNVVDMQWK
jgi:hypothetical protein